MAPSSISLSCACRAITGTITLPPSTPLPLALEICHCSSCRHSSGQLAISGFACPRSSSDGPPTLNITSKTQPVAYKTSEDLVRYFCASCGASVYMYVPASGDMEVCSGVLEGEGVEEVLRFTQHIFVEDSGDGGMSAWVEGPRWKGWGEKSEVFQMPGVKEAGEKPRAAEKEGGGGERRLQAHCHCRGVEFYVTPPDEEERGPSSVANDNKNDSSQSQTSNNEKWWLRASNTKYLAGLCACNSCRLATGFDIQAWAFVPKTHIRQINGKEVDFKMGTLKTYSHTPGTYRDFCGKCGATVFWRCEGGRGDVIDISAGLLDAAEGARAEEWLEWRTQVSFEECAANKGLVAKVAEGLKKWGDS